MKYFLPDNDDRVDSNYRFIDDIHSDYHHEKPEEHDSYIWEIYGVDDIPFDGILISRMTMKNNKSKYERTLEKGIHEILRIPKKFEIMGDCGAFGYISEEEPPFNTKDTLEYYIKCGFNYGVSIDHLIIPAFEYQKERRWKITIENARDMYELWKSKDRYFCSLRLIGVAQGWDPSSYRAAVQKLLEIGYDYIALGGLVRSPSGQDAFDGYYHKGKTVLNVLSAVSTEIRKWIMDTKQKIDLHIFGVARPDLMQTFNNLGVTSFDSASFLRRAWLGADRNYLTIEGMSYGALRIPQIDKSKITRNHKSKNKFKKLEKRALDLCRKFDTGTASLKETLSTIVAYDTAIGEKRKFEKYYEQTLADRPWKDCPCTICRELGVEVMVFRGNNRNRRRGFHNTFAFYNRFRGLYPKFFAFTFCTATKDPNERLLPAYLRYGASNNMRSFWNSVYDLPIDIGMFSAKFGLINWNTPIPNYNYKLQADDLQKFVLSLREQLNQYDKIFFIGLSGYRKVVETIKNEDGFDIEIFPKSELAKTNGRTRPLDIIEYAKQMKNFRSAILENMPDFNNKKERITMDMYL